jgi:hypothetical protein
MNKKTIEKILLWAVIAAILAVIYFTEGDRSSLIWCLLLIPFSYAVSLFIARKK